MATTEDGDSRGCWSSRCRTRCSIPPTYSLKRPGVSVLSAQIRTWPLRQILLSGYRLTVECLASRTRTAANHRGRSMLACREPSTHGWTEAGHSSQTNLGRQHKQVEARLADHLFPPAQADAKAECVMPPVRTCPRPWDMSFQYESEIAFDRYGQMRGLSTIRTYPRITLPVGSPALNRVTDSQQATRRMARGPPMTIRRTSPISAD